MEQFDSLRVADVSDGMDAAGLQNIGLMDASIRPLWKDTEKFSHRFIGIAVTARYVPTQLLPAGRMTTAEYDAWAGNWYGKRSSEPFVALLRKGSALVIEDAAAADVGSIGSNNILGRKLKGCVGVVTRHRATRMRSSRKESPIFEAGRGIGLVEKDRTVNQPIVCGGVLVMPGDVTPMAMA